MSNIYHILARRYQLPDSIRGNYSTWVWKWPIGIGSFRVKPFPALISAVMKNNKSTVTALFMLIRFIGGLVSVRRWKWRAHWPNICHGLWKQWCKLKHLVAWLTLRAFAALDNLFENPWWASHHQAQLIQLVGCHHWQSVSGVEQKVSLPCLCPCCITWQSLNRFCSRVPLTVSPSCLRRQWNPDLLLLLKWEPLPTCPWLKSRVTTPTTSSR